MLELVWLLLTTVLAWMHPRQDHVVENVLLRDQVAVLTRPARARPRVPLRTWDKLLSVLARRLCTGWRQPAPLLRNAQTIVRWHRQG